MNWPDRLERWRTPIEAAAAASGLEPVLIAAVMDRESLGGEALTPPGAAGTGDFGHGRGLMQIDDRFHQDFCTDVATWSNPYANAEYGARLLAANLAALNGDLPAAIAAYNAGLHRVQLLTAVVSDPTIAQLDKLTTGGDYVSDVLRRMANLDGGDTTTEAVT